MSRLPRTSYLVASPGILGVETNSDYLGWSFGHPPFSSTAEELDACRVHLRFEVDDLDDLPERSRDLEKYHYWRCAPGLDHIYYQRTFAPGRPIRLEVSGIASGEPRMATNPAFLRWIRFRFNNLHSPGYHLTDLACALLLQRGLSPLHCSAFRRGDATVVVVAPPDSGKTLTTMRAVFDAHADFLAEDLAITDGETLYACPWTSTFRYYDDLSMGWRSKLRMRLVKLFPPAELLPPPGDARTIDAYVDASRIVSRAPITHVAILSRRQGASHELDPVEALRCLINLNRYEFPYLKNPLLLAYSYFNPELDLRALVAREEAVLATMVEKARCMLVQDLDPSRFAGQIFDWIS